MLAGKKPFSNRVPERRQSTSQSILKLIEFSNQSLQPVGVNCKPLIFRTCDYLIQQNLKFEISKISVLYTP